MIIAVTSTGEGLDQMVDDRLGRCAVFAIYDTDSKDLNFIHNQAKNASGGAGARAAQQMIDLGVDLLITGKVGPMAMEVLSEGDIRVESWTSGTVGEAIQQFGGK